MTIFEAYNSTKKRLEAAGIEDYVFEAKQIIKHITGLNNTQILTLYNNSLTKFQENNLTALLRQREIRYPLQYIFGEWDFYGRGFYVGPGVLVPRADTETLVEHCLEFLKQCENPQILDLCAGSGAIGITLAKEIASAEVLMLEKYPEALSYTQKNIARNGAENAKAAEGDIFVSDGAEPCRYDLIVSNPPYIPKAEMKTISPETEFEPETALLGGEDGLDFYRAIIKNYTQSLKKGGMLAFEVGINQFESVVGLLTEAGFGNVTVKNDLNGIGRVVSGINI
ncbi:MAG: peptide chain release factor N(5)-glutamine methyltransferase [Clostridia bacterium]|nr:peptide chain release factor N(5)-glutamine methyltransferase [Clostridia bacterium]